MVKKDKRVMNMAGLFGKLLDFSHDGKMSIFEETAEFASIIDSVDATEKVNELEAAGIDTEEYDFD